MLPHPPPKIWRFVTTSADRGWLIDDPSHGGVFVVDAEARRLLRGVGRDSVPDLAQFVQETVGSEPTLVPPLLTLGERHPRVYRPSLNLDHARTFEVEAAAALQEARLLTLDMEATFAVVEPEPQHLSVFGHAIRHSLMLACMEVESSCKAILRANGAEGSRVGEYARLHGPLMLEDWSVTFLKHPRLGRLRPFENWVTNGTRNRLAWFGSYNDTKHDRELQLGAATLEAMVNAVAAVLVLIAAQFGPGYVVRDPALAGVALDPPVAWPPEAEWVPPWLLDLLDQNELSAGEGHDARWQHVHLQLPSTPRDPSPPPTG